MEQIQNTINKYNTLQAAELFGFIKSKWHWFILSLGITVGCTLYFFLATAPEYKRSASILIKDDSKGGNIGAAADAIADLGFFQSGVNIQNELLVIQATQIIHETVKKLQLNERYSVKNELRFTDLYQISPISISLPDKPENDYARYIIQIISPKEFEIIEVWHNESSLKLPATRGHFGQSIATPMGEVNITTTQYMDDSYVGQMIHYSNVPTIMAAETLTSKLKFDLGNKAATIIDLSISDVSTKRAEDILNTVIEIYGDAWIRDKNQIAQSTSKFINERLQLIELELNEVDSDISSYKSENLLPDVQAVSNQYLAQSSKNDARILELNTQYSIAQFISEYIQKATLNEQLLPANSGIDSRIEAQISEYNTLILERNILITNSSTKNPLVIDLDQSLKSMRKAIITSLGDQIEILSIQLDKVYQSEALTQKKISNNPTQVKYLLTVERQQKIKESLYLFLLQKREENELTYAFTAYNTRVISPPLGSITPVFPNKIKFMLAAILIGLIVPGFILLLLESINTRIKSRKDLYPLSIPIIGEIPWVRKKRWWPFLLKRSDVRSSINIVINTNNRDRINESFRIIRTNIDFMLEDNKQHSVMMVTSMNPNSGKTFITTNLAISMGIKGSKVLIIDLDLRKATASAIVDNPKIGVSDYLAGKYKLVNDLIIKNEAYDNIYVLPVGKIPPNPSELLSSPKLKELIDDLRSQYDYILLDCTPIDIIADAAIVNKVSDTTIFVIRGGVFDKMNIPYIQELYDNKKYNNLRIVLNSSDVYEKYEYKKYGYSQYGKGV